MRRFHTAITRVELFHLVFLDLLGRKLDRRFYALKGGCNLRFYLHSFRYSEDLDLDVKAIATDKLRDTVDGILGSKATEQILRARGLRIETWSAPKQTETTQRWKMTLSAGNDTTPLHTKVEFSRRRMSEATAFEPVDPELILTYRLPPIMANHYTAQAAYEQKIEAAATRSITQARDVFDLALLLDSGVNPSVMSPGVRKQLDQAQANIMTVTFDIFKGQVLSYLPPERQAQYDSPSLWEERVLRIVETLEGANTCNSSKP